MDLQQIDLLKKAEESTAKLNQLFNEKGKPVFFRYPLLFAMLVIVGATMVSMGVKELLLEITTLKNNPSIMLLAGFLILIATGTLFKKLKKG